MRGQILCALCSAIVALGSAAVVQAQPSLQAGRFGVSGTVGVLHPLHGEVSDVYGGALVSVTGHLDVRLAPWLSLFGGLKETRASGQSVVIGTPVADERHATSLRMASFRFGALMSHRIADRWTLAGGAGASIAAYEEAWPDAQLDVSDRATGFLALGEGRYSLGPKWAIVARIEYSTIPTSAKEPAVAANLGGIDASAGVRFAF